MLERFERCKTPMGSVPISVIMGFDYPLEAPGGRGEVSAYSTHTNNYATRYSQPRSCSPSCLPSSSYSSHYMDRNMLERIPRSSPGQTWPSSLQASSLQPSSLSTTNYSVYTGYRAQSQAREDSSSSRWRKETSALMAGAGKEHPKQEPCHYASALAATSIDSSHRRRAQSRARTVAPSTPSLWRRAASSSTTRYSSSSTYGQHPAVRSLPSGSRFY